MRTTDLWDDWHVRHVATHTDGSLLARIVIFSIGFIHFLFEIVWHRPDLVHLHTSERGSFYRKGLLVWVTHCFKLPVILHAHGPEFHEYYSRSHPLIRWFIRSTLQRCDIVVALGTIWADRLRNIAPGADIEVIPNSVRLQNAVHQPVAKDVQVVFVGRLCERKGISLLIDVWARLISSHQILPTKLIVAGWGEIERARHQSVALGIEEFVEIRGWMPKQRLDELLDTSHVVVLPSLNEGQPMALLEAMARGICVVSTTVGGIPEMVGEAEGVLVSPNSTVELGEALARVLNDRGSRVKYGASARSKVERDFNLIDVSRRLDVLYDLARTDDLKSRHGCRAAVCR